MKPHPRIRKTVKWGGAVVSVLLLVAWVGSGWGQLYWMSRRGCDLGIAGGQFFAIIADVDMPPDRCGLHTRAFPQYLLTGGFRFREDAILTSLAIPLWLPFAIASTASIAAWHLDTLARRRARIGHCPNCNYDRTGLAPDAVCPECGTPAPPSVASEDRP